MNRTDITQIGAVRADTMGASIAEVFAEAGYPVNLVQPVRSRQRPTDDRGSG